MSMSSTEHLAEIVKNNRTNRISLSGGRSLPRIGQGTWNMGEDASRREEEIAALRLGVELGMDLIDTAEMYGDGRSERLVGEAIQGIRDEVFLVSKVYPHNAGNERLIRSCEESLKRLNTDHLDLYLLHWRGDIPLEVTVEGMEKLVSQGKIARWGVSNLDIHDMKELLSMTGGSQCATNQVLYHLGSRGVETELLPWQRSHKIPVMAYSPLAQAGTLRKGVVESEVVQDIARNHEVSPLQIMLAWTIRENEMISIPKASYREHVIANAAAGLIKLSEAEKWRLHDAFPTPAWKVPLDMI